MARYINLYRIVTVRTSRFGARGLTRIQAIPPPIQKNPVCARSNATLLITASRRTANAMSCALETVTISDGNFDSFKIFVSF